MASTGALDLAIRFPPHFAATPKLVISASATSPQTEYKTGESKTEEFERLNFKLHVEQSQHKLRLDGGPPRWCSPLECGRPLHNSPLFLSLPAIIDGVALGRTLQYKRLGQIFDVWSLHVPIDDKTSFQQLVKMVERTVRAEKNRSPNRPIYLVGESFGGCLAIAVAALNPDIDLVLILANPASSFNKSWLQLLIHVLKIVPVDLLSSSGVPYVLGLMKDVLSLLWRLKLVKSACEFANSRLHAVKAQTLILSSCKDQLHRQEGERLRSILPKSQIRTLDNASFALFSENCIDLVSIIMGTRFYRRAKNTDHVSDYLSPSTSQFKKLHESTGWIEKLTSPVMLSTFANGEIVRGLAGIPSEGPVLYVGYHMLVGMDLCPLINSFWIDHKIHLRGLAHPMMFKQLNIKNMPDFTIFDFFKIMGAVPVSAANIYGLLSQNSHFLLYPGGLREAFHRRGEEYKLFWPEQSEFIRVAARFGAKIIPFGTVGEDDVAHLLLDYNDQMKIPFVKPLYDRLTAGMVKLRTDSEEEIANQNHHIPVLLPKVPGRFYYLFGAPIETQGRNEELKNKEEAQKVYIEVKKEVERCLAYLKEKRKEDPYRNIVARLVYKARYGTESEIPTFEL